jgi:hypothetical protein
LAKVEVLFYLAYLKIIYISSDDITDEVAAALVLWALKTLVLKPPYCNVVLIYQLKISLGITLSGFTGLVNSWSVSLNGFFRFMYA